MKVLSKVAGFAYELVFLS